MPTERYMISKVCYGNQYHGPKSIHSSYWDLLRRYILKFQRVITIQGEDMNHASRINAEMEESWHHLTSTKSETTFSLGICGVFKERRAAGFVHANG